MEQTMFTDSDGVLWIVREDGADEARSSAVVVPPRTAWLRFESDLEVRRLWHYPDDWRGLSSMQLESLLDRASTVIARFRPAMHRPANINDSLDSAAKVADVRVAAPQRADATPVDPSSLSGRKPA
jgi:hypothetical protein